MFHTSDKLDKSNLKYDLINDQKINLISEATIESECLPVPKNTRSKNHICRWFILILVLLTSGLWLLPTSNYNISFRRSFDPTILSNTIKTVNEANAILHKVKDSVALISADNNEMALKYVEAIQDMLQDRTRMATMKINQIITDQIREIQNELTSFDYVITEASGGIVDYTLQDMRSLRETFSTSTTNATYRTDLENIFKTVDEKMTSAFEDLDSMYTFYGSYMGDIIEHKVNNATDRISKIVNSNRRFCECTIKEKVNFCYTVSTQNVKVSQQLEAVVRVIGILHHTADVLDTLEPTSLMAGYDKHSCNLFTEARTVMNKALSDAESLLDTVLKDDNCFLGSAVRKVTNEKHQQQKQSTLNTFQASIQSLSDDFNSITTGFQVVKEKHRKVIEQDLIKGLTALADEIRAKAEELPQFASDEYEERLSFADMRSYMDNKFQNATNVINTMFEKRQKEIADGLKYTSQFITFQQLPSISTLSVNNYLPTDVCPLSTDYQAFMAITLSHCTAPVEENALNQLTTSSSSSNNELDDEGDNTTSDFIQNNSDDKSNNNGIQTDNSDEAESETNTSSNLTEDMLSKVLGGIVQDIVNGNVAGASDTQLPIATVVITDYQVTEDESNNEISK